jgi:hypothetical protein
MLSLQAQERTWKKYCRDHMAQKRQKPVSAMLRKTPMPAWYNPLPAMLR